MPKVLLAGYSDYYDVTTGIQFQPALDRPTGLFVAVADVTEDQADAYAARPAFRVLSDEDYLALSRPAPAPAPAPSPTGDPLTDQARQAGSASPTALDGPPAPPSS